MFITVVADLLRLNVVTHVLSLLVLSTAKRLKKGMATAKQRLGKILKIHRNGKLLL